MTQTTNRLFDELGRFMTDAAGAAQGLMREIETMTKTQVEKFIAGMDLVRRDEFEACREMAQRAREDNEKLAARLAELERRLGAGAEAPAEPAHQ